MILADNKQEFFNCDLFPSLSTSNSHLRGTRQESRKFFGELQKSLWRVMYRLESPLRGSSEESEERFPCRAQPRIFISSFIFFL